MVGGQVVDVEAEKRGETAISREKLDFIYRLKTGALIEASMMVGAILADAPEAEITSIGQVAADIGLAFQIQDDILDVTSSTEVLGKPVGSDEKNEKSTYVTLEGLKQAAEDVERFSKEASDILRNLNRDDAFLQEMIRYLVHREK
jgi:geranylgeranyl diphosphate synthase type II